MRHVFLHLGDFHLAPGVRREDKLIAVSDAMARGLELVRENELAGWLWPGDLFHAKSTIDDRNTLASILMSMAEMAPVLIVPGNHDVPGDLAIFGRMESSHPIIVQSDSQVIKIVTATGQDAYIFCLPYVHRGTFVAEGIEPSEVASHAKELLKPLLTEAADRLSKARRDGGIALAIGHINVADSVSSVGQPQVGKEIELDAELLAPFGCYVGLNHIHRHQVVHGAVYAGSMCRMDFGENEPKGFVEVTYTDEGDGYRMVWRFCELDVPAQYLIEGELTASQFEYLVPEGCGEEFWVGADVRARYRYRRADAAFIDTDLVTGSFPGCRSLKLEPVPEHEVEVRAPEVAQASTLEAKVQAYCKLAKVEWTDGLGEKVSQVQQ